MIYANSHCDMLTKSYDSKKEILDTSLMFNVSDVVSKLPYIECLAIFISNMYEKDKYEYGYTRTKEIIDYYNSQFKKYSSRYNLYKILKKEDIYLVEKNKKLGIVLTIENMSAIGKNINNIDDLVNSGVRIASLTWNNDNLVASGCFSNNDNGITIFGKKVLNKMSDYNMILDLSHISDNSFNDVINYGYKKIMATHSCARSICNNKRNLTDEQIKKISSNNGIIGICLYNGFLTEVNKKATIDDIIDHIVYISNLIGIDKVCIGSDFDGLEKEDLPIGITGVRDINKIEERMIERNFYKSDIEKIFGINLKNFLYKNL